MVLCTYIFVGNIIAVEKNWFNVDVSGTAGKICGKWRPRIGDKKISFSKGQCYICGQLRSYI